jgi:transposase InsO family protein
MDKSPTETYATLLDEGIYFCSISTMYRLLREEGATQERRRGHRRHQYAKPELLAIAPNQVWSWDITKLKGPVKWSYYYLYVVLDIFSRYVVGWYVAERETGELAKKFISEIINRERVNPELITIHSDRGSPMKSSTLGQLFIDLGMNKSFGRPRVSNDNPYSESQFKTLKYSQKFPDRFKSLEEAKDFCREFFPWYNNEHHHSGLELLTPNDVHRGLAEEKLILRQNVLLSAYDNNPNRFVLGTPKKKEIPKEVWINRPVEAAPDQGNVLAQPLQDGLALTVV